ncbi:DUF1750-domain-containing protein, partial [Rhizodiscina lignyota]
QQLPHVHLVSEFRLPVTHTMSLDMAVDYLIQAPKIVREVHAMSWTYFSTPPPDGQSFLVWQPQRQGLRASSDGYIWVDPETSFQQEVKGYTIEIVIHRSGYRLGEQFTAHSRQRFRLIGKNPAAPGPNPDPSLWIIHYSGSEAANRFPVQRFPPQADIVKQQRERQMLEQQGQLPRRPFMLHDRQNWPQVNLSGPGSMPGPTGGMFPSQMQQQMAGMMGQPPSKRLRQTGPAQMPGMGAPGMPPGMAGIQHDPFLEEEESVALGDYFDHLTPREISIVRYTQHHEWMEEIFSSPYPAHQIAPVDLGLGLSGELAEITRGILDAPVGDPKVPSKQYSKLDQAQQEEFEKRVNAFIAKGEGELERMRAEHAKTMAELRKGKTYMKAERQLKDAQHAMRESSPAEEGSPDPIDAIVQGVENTLGVTVGPRRDVLCVSKGGLIEEEQKPQEEVNGTKDESANGAQDAFNGNGFSNDDMEEDANVGDNTAAGLLDQFGNSASFDNTPGANLSTPQMSNPVSQAQSATGTPGVTAADQNQTPGFSNQDGMQGGVEAADGDGLDLIEGMDLDIPDITVMPEDDHEPPAEDWVMVSDESGDADQDNDVTQAAQSPATAPTATNPTPATSNNTPGMFDATNDFENDFTNIDSAGDALADFTGAGGDGMDDLGLDDSAFGEAMQGMDSTDDVGAGEAGETAGVDGAGAEAGDGGDAVTAGHERTAAAGEGEGEGGTADATTGGDDMPA